MLSHLTEKKNRKKDGERFFKRSLLQIFGLPRSAVVAGSPSEEQIRMKDKQ